MPVTKLDSTAALIVIDVQKGIVGLPTVHPTTEIVARSAKLARAFRQRGLPVVLVNVTGAAPGRTDVGPRHLRDADAHRHCLEKIFPRISQTDTTDSVLKLLKESH